MSRPLWKRIGYDFLHLSIRMTTLVLARVRCEGRHHMPREGAVLVCSNHQSSLDPPLVGMAIDRRLNFLAKESLFRIPLFKYLISYLDAIPIDREGSSLSGIKETLKRLKREEAVLIFPEGTRSRTGELQPLKPGFVAVARRSKAPLVPVGMDGSYQCWPPNRSFPWPHPIAIVIGEPIRPEDVTKMTDDELIAELERRMHECFSTAQKRVRRTEKS